jgi:hypothetical protein
VDPNADGKALTEMSSDELSRLINELESKLAAEARDVTPVDENESNGAEPSWSGAKSGGVGVGSLRASAYAKRSSKSAVRYA